MIKRNDVILIGTILLIAFITIFTLNIKRSNGSQVVITMDGKIYKTLSLDEDQNLILKKENGSENMIEIKDGFVSMKDANCPDKLCVKHNKIHYNNETIVCLPNKVVLEIINANENEVDMISR